MRARGRREELTDCTSRGGRSGWPGSHCRRPLMGDACRKAPKTHTERQASRKSGGRATDGSHMLQPPFPRPRGPQQKSKCERGAGLCEQPRNQRQASQAMQLRVPACSALNDRLSKEALRGTRRAAACARRRRSRREQRTTRPATRRPIRQQGCGRSGDAHARCAGTWAARARRRSGAAGAAYGRIARTMGLWQGKCYF